MLIRDAELGGHENGGGRIVDVRLSDGIVAGVGCLTPLPGEVVLDARGGALLPGLHDHHIHLFALAAAGESIRCGPPDVVDEHGLAACLQNAPGQGWIRGIGYHEHVAGDMDRAWLDRHCPDRPVRIQHRGGRRWIVNSAGLALLMAAGDAPPPGVDVARGHIDDADAWLRQRLSATFPDLAATSAVLASYGVTGLTEMTPSNDGHAIDYLASQQANGALLQQVLLAGRADMPFAGSMEVRPILTKIHLHEARLPPFGDICRTIADSHDSGRPVAVHCVTRTELVFTLAALGEAGVLAGDRIEHASVAPDELVAQMMALGIQVVTQPNFIRERGDAYLRDVEPDDLPFLYRCAGLTRAGLVLAGGTDAPFGHADPWAAMQAAVERRTMAGAVVGVEERLSPEDALGLFLARGEALGTGRHVGTGVPADLCLLRAPWSKARAHLCSDLVRATIRAGALIFQRVDEAPF